MEQRRTRIVALDIVRGLFLLIILADHSAWFPSFFFQIFTANTALLSSAAEGFFMVSGVLVGYIYGPKILTKPKSVITRLLKRALLLYFLTVTLTVLYALWAKYLIPPEHIRLTNVWEFTDIGLVYRSMLMQYFYGWADFLARYSVFMVLAIPSLWLLAKGKWYIVAISSFFIWFFFRDSNVQLSLTSWQIVFIFGIIAGYYLPKIEAVLGFFPEKKKTTYFSKYIVYSFGVTYVLAVLLTGVLSWVLKEDIIPALQPLLTNVAMARDYVILNYFDKDSVAPGRLIIGIIWFAGIYIIVRRFEDVINKWTFNTLDTLGKNSLFVYCLQSFVIFALDALFWPPYTGNIFLNTLINIVIATVIFVATYYKQNIVHNVKKALRYRRNETS